LKITIIIKKYQSKTKILQFQLWEESFSLVHCWLNSILLL